MNKKTEDFFIFLVISIFIVFLLYQFSKISFLLQKNID